MQIACKLQNVGRSQNPGGRRNVVVIICPPVEIGLNDLSKYPRHPRFRQTWVVHIIPDLVETPIKYITADLVNKQFEAKAHSFFQILQLKV